MEQEKKEGNSRPFELLRDDRSLIRTDQAQADTTQHDTRSRFSSLMYRPPSWQEESINQLWLIVNLLRVGRRYIPVAKLESVVALFLVGWFASTFIFMPLTKGWTKREASFFGGWKEA